MARGFSSDQAEKLKDDGWTLSKLKQAGDKELGNAGLSSSQISAIREGQRPPIPRDTLNKLLFQNRFVCCVCREHYKPIVVHHIDEWSRSHSHELSNLAVLCLDHHAKAHTKGGLDQNLDASVLRTFKKNWEDEVRNRDSRSIIEGMAGEYSHWSMINETRLFELIAELGIDPTTVAGFQRALRDGIIDETGLPIPVSKARAFRSDGVEILTRYQFIKNLLHAFIKNAHIVNVSDYLDKSIMMPAIAQGDFIVVQGRHRFASLSKTKRGPGQRYRGTRKANGVCFTYVFDLWEATTCSAWAEWLRGTKAAASLLQVKDISRDSDCRLVLTGTILAIGSFANGLRDREYGGNWKWAKSDDLVSEPKWLEDVFDE
ncbi:HNH endonuclease signature motif containing protein [Novosphingobium tardum]|uniref:HNH endonuclease signature motif containing protein n=1 Tax=Novosphingobium tardum TaxID=1538021 RepID=A0ABV8RNN5_9SPHN